MPGPADKAYAILAAAMALKRLVHIPFSRRIEKGELFPVAYGLQGNQYFVGGIKEAIGITAVVNAFQILWQKQNVFMFTDLNSKVGRLVVNLVPTEFRDDFIGLKVLA